MTPDSSRRPSAAARAPTDGAGVGRSPEYRVEALAKGLRILSLFDEQRPTWRVTDLAAAAGLPMPTVYRVVHDADRRGLPRPPAQRRLPARRTHADARHRRAAQPRPRRRSRRRSCSGSARRPARRSTWRCSPATRCSTSSGCATPTSSPRTSRSARRCRRSPPRSASCCSPTSTTPTCRRASPRRRSPRSTARTPRSRWQSCARSCDQIREQGWAMQDEELAYGLRSVAGPMTGSDGRVVAGVNLAVQARDWSTQRIVRELRPARPRRPAPRSPPCCRGRRRE